jgi:hypothetical protein
LRPCEHTSLTGTVRWFDQEDQRRKYYNLSEEVGARLIAVRIKACGHVCAECRRERYNAFKDAWQLAHRLDGPPFADDMDLELHPARIDRRKKVTYEVALDSLPDGCFVQIQGSAYLVWRDALLLWTPEGSAGRDARPNDPIVMVLTPGPIVECFRQGYRPEIHETARLR